MKHLAVILTNNSETVFYAEQAEPSPVYESDRNRLIVTTDTNNVAVGLPSNTSYEVFTADTKEQLINDIQAAGYDTTKIEAQ